MDNFRNNRARQHGSSAVDGFLSSRGKPARRPPVSRGRTTPAAGSAPARTQLNNFRGSDGFLPNVQPKLKASARPQQAGGTRPGRIRQPMQPMDITLPGEGKKKKKRRFRSRKTVKILSVFAVLVLLVGGYFVGRTYLAVNGIFKGGGNAPALSKNVDPTKLRGEGDGRVNILMLGKGGMGHDGADLTDTLLVASMDPVNKKASILSIPRDFWVKSSKGGQSKINAVYANAKSAVLNGRQTSDINQRAEQAGVSAISTTIESAMGIPIHYYVMVDFQGFVQAINTVGGVDIYVDPKDDAGIVRETLWDELTRKNYRLDVRAGNNHFDGQRALMYARSRHTSTRGDFDRAERQRKILIALKDKVMSAGTYGNPVKVNQLITNFGSHVQSNLSTNEVLRVYDIVKGINSAHINSVGLADPPNNYVTTDMVNGQSIVRPRAGLFDYSEIQNYVRNTLKDGYIQNENAIIAVYNGSTKPGLASKKATELKSFGYNIPTVANAPTQTYAKTVLVDLTKGTKKYTKHYLEQRLKVTATTTLPDPAITATGADFVIILGQNEN
jgi:polyisoprenyl-teichoic acid--peptidoglycan teichoic acid transferase